MDCTAIIQNKMSKVEGSLKELNDEILIATKYLLNLKENSLEVVRNLNQIMAPSTYLEEFLNVNSFLLKSISFLADFNCKFEIFVITEKALSNSMFADESQSLAVKSKIPEESEDHFNCSCSEELKSNESNKILVKDLMRDIKGISEGTDLNNQKPKEKSKTEMETEKLKLLTYMDKKTDNNIAANSAASNVKNRVKKKNNSVPIKNNNNRGSKAKEAKQKSNLGVINNSQGELPAEKICAEGMGGDNKSGTEADLQRISSDINHEQTKEVSCKESSTSVADELPNNASSSPVLCSTTQSCGSIPVAEVVPTKITDRKLEDSEHFNQGQDSEEDCIKKASQLTKEQDDELEEIKPADIVRTVGKEYNVVVEYIKSPSEFYVSISDKETNLLMELENKLKEIPANKYVSDNTKSELTKTVLRGEVGSYCLVYLKCDEMWCRAKVTNWCLEYNDNFVNVFLFDYGEYKCVSIYDLQAMPKHLKQYPAFTVRCHLHDVFPVDMDKNTSKLSWGKDTSEEMKSLIEDSQNVRIKVGPSDSFHSDTSLPVTLWLVDQGNECINELLVSSKFAIHLSDFVETKEQKIEIVDDCAGEILDDVNEANSSLSSWNPMKEDYESYKNSYDLDVNDPSAIIYGYVGKDYDRICRHYAKTGYCYKGLACRKEHKKLDHLGFTTDQEEIFHTAINELPVPSPHSKVNIQVTCLLAFNKFFCFMESPKSSPQEEDLQSLLQYMNKRENILEMRKLLIPPSAGQIVIACYSVDKAWYRARVLESQPEKDQYKILFVDYGNTEALHLSDIRAMEGRYLHLPFQAMQCCIFGVDQNPEVPSAEALEYMKQRINDGHLSIEVISRLPGDNINLLVNVFDQKGVSIGKDLISKKYAILKKEMIINPSSGSIPG